MCGGVREEVGCRYAPVCKKGNKCYYKRMILIPLLMRRSLKILSFFSSIKSIGNIVSNVVFAYMERERVDNQMIF